MPKKKNVPPPPNKTRHLQVVAIPGMTADRQSAELAADGLLGNAIALVDFGRVGIGELSLTDCMAVLRERGEAVNRGDMMQAESLLAAQAVSLNAIYSELVRRAALNMGEHLPAMETYVRLALKAQSQCRSTIETLAEMKNPPVVFARQANIANGPQQVNNGVFPTSTRAGAQAGETRITPTELLEDASDGRTQLDTRATTTTSGANTELEPVEAIHRSAH